VVREKAVERLPAKQMQHYGIEMIAPHTSMRTRTLTRGRDSKILNSQACRDNFFAYRMGFYGHPHGGGYGALAGEWCSADSLTHAHGIMPDLSQLRGSNCQQITLQALRCEPNQFQTKGQH
jgi:hypothetical protein